MSKFGKAGQELIAQTPITLLALTRHSIEPHEENWFARCRADYLRAFPLSLLELVRLLMLVSLVGPFRSFAYTVSAVAGWAAVMGVQFHARRKEMVPGFDERAALRNRAGTIRIRSMWWCAMLAWGIVIAPHAHHEGLVALGVAMMTIDGLGAMSLPHLALGASIAGGCAIVLGMLASDGAAAAPVAVAVLVMATFLHWSIYNLYYLFATRRIRTRRLAQSNETIRLLLNQYDDEGSDWLYETDFAGRILNPTPRFCAACGQAAGQLEGMPLTALISMGQYRQELHEKLEGRAPFRNLVVPLTVNGEERWWSISGRPVDRLRGKEGGWRGFIADVSAAKQAEARVAFMAHFDLLTNLPNRSLFNVTLDRVMARKPNRRAIGVLFIDLNDFKEINDGHGHAAGDLILAEVGRRLEHAIRPGDTAARLGGDEFAVLLPNLPSRKAGLAIARQIMDSVCRPVDVDGQLMTVGASIGAAFAPQDGKTGDELLRSADLAMYDAKARGRNQISVFDIGMQEQMQERRALELGLRTAIVNRELELHYQPLVDVATGSTTGFEALLRWNHPSRGMIQPDAFIPIAEESGLIIEIGEWVIRSALADAARWPDHITVAVNVSPAQMRDGKLLALVANALAASGVAPSRLELEITENLLMQESEEVLAMLHRLRKLGVRVTLDDFGTGYSSLNYLRSFPFDKIKIDRSFVRELAEREDCEAIVRSVITLANDLKMITTAEGVENDQQLDALRREGCVQVQGYLFSQALPSAQLGFETAAEDRAAAESPENIVELPARKSGKGRQISADASQRIAG